MPTSPPQTAGPAGPSVGQMIAQMQAGATPPRRGRSQPGGLPNEPLSPPPGCHVDELHAWAKRMFSKIDDVLKGVITEQGTQRLIFDKLKDSMNSFDEGTRRIKGLETGVERSMARANEAADLAHKHGQDAAGAVHGLRGELSGFAATLEASSQHIAKIEAEYRVHVATNFAAVETECRELRAISTFAAASVASSAPPGVGSASSGSAGGVSVL